MAPLENYSHTQNDKVSNSPKKYPLLNPKSKSELKKYNNSIKNLGSAFLPGFTKVNALCEFFCTCKTEQFIKRVEYFFDATNYSDEELHAFFRTLDEDKKELIHEFLIERLFSADEHEKAFLYGLIYNDAVLNKTSTDQLMRLCKAIEMLFISDLQHLKKYINYTDSSPIGVALINAGLLIDSGFNGGCLGDDSSGGTVYNLSPLGEKLLQILINNRWKPLL